jgi:putative transposase
MASTGKRYSEEQIIAILKEADGSGNVGEVIRRHGISAHTYYRWKSKYSGMDVSEARRLKALEDENRRLKRIVADQTLNIQILKEALGKD